MVEITIETNQVAPLLTPPPPLVGVRLVRLAPRPPVLTPSARPQTVYAYKCKHVTLVINGKGNSVTLDNCQSCACVFDDMVGGFETVRCKKLQVQCKGFVPTMQVDNTEGIVVFVSKKAESSGMSVRSPPPHTPPRTPQPADTPPRTPQPPAQQPPDPGPAPRGACTAAAHPSTPTPPTAPQLPWCGLCTCPARYSYLLTRLCHAPAADPAPVHRNQPHDPPTGRRRGGGRSRAPHPLAVPYQIRRRFVTNHRARTPSPTALLTRSSRRQVGDGAGGGDRLTCARRCAGRTNQEKGLLRC